MNSVLEWMELTYEAEFSSPSFDLPGSQPALMRSLYHSFHSVFPLRIGDLHAFGGTALSDVSVRVTLLGGDGTIDVTADRFSARFVGMTRPQDLETCHRCIALAEQALAGTLSDVSIHLVSIRPILTLRLGGESVDARDYLRRLVTPGVGLDLEGLGAVALHPCVNLELENVDERWQAVLHAYPSAFNNSSVVAACSIVYTESPEPRTAEERNGRLWRLIAVLLTGLGLDLPPAVSMLAS